MSAVFPLLMLRDLNVIDPGRFPSAGVASRLASGLSHLELLQTEDGGIGMWPGERSAWPWASVYAAHFLVSAKALGVAVPDALMSRLLGYVHRLGDHLTDEWMETQAYGCYVLALAGMPDAGLMHRLDVSLDCVNAGSWIAPATRFLLSAAYAAAGRHDLALGMLPQHMPQLEPASGRGDDLATPVRERALLLSTLLRVAPDHPEIPRLAQQLARAESWHSTQDTAMALLALGDYLRQTKPQVPATAVRLSIDGAVIASAATDSCSWNGSNLSSLQAAVVAPATGTAWLSWTLTGVPLAPLAPCAHGLTVSRTWSTPEGVALKTITAGTLILVQLQVRSLLQVPLVVVEDLLPGGFEVENPRLHGSAQLQDQPPAAVPGVAGAPEDSAGVYLDLRQDRVVVVGDLQALGDGGWGMRYRYLARAVVPGHYTLPAVRAEGMYDSRINAASGAGTLTVEPRP